MDRFDDCIRKGRQEWRPFCFLRRGGRFNDKPLQIFPSAPAKIRTFCMNQRQPKKQNAIERLCTQASEAWKQQDYPKSISLLEQAVQREPFNPSLHLNLARAHGLRYDYSAAVRCIEKALQHAQGRVEILEEAAAICTIKNVDLMLGYLERASQKKGVSIGALTSLADTYILDGRLDDAAQLIERAALLDRNDPRVLYGESVLKRERGQISEAESQFRALVTNSAADFLTRVRSGYALAGILDRAGQYDDAMTALLEVKAIQRPQAAALAAPLQQMQQLHTEMARSITPAILERWRADSVRLQPSRRIALLTGHRALRARPCLSRYSMRTATSLVSKRRF